MEDPRQLRELAAWYRELAERAGHLARPVDDRREFGARGQSLGKGGVLGSGWGSDQ